MFMTSLRLLYLKNDVNVPSKSNKQNYLFFVGVLKVADEKSRTRDQEMSQITFLDIQYTLQMPEKPLK